MGDFEPTDKTYKKHTGNKFRLTPKQKELVDSGKMTRLEAFDQFVASGRSTNIRKQNKMKLPLSFWLTEGLTLDNFSDKVYAVMGFRRRFRVTPEQLARMKAGLITRDMAFAETVSAKKLELETGPGDQRSTNE